MLAGNYMVFEFIHACTHTHQQKYVSFGAGSYYDYTGGFVKVEAKTTGQAAGCVCTRPCVCHSIQLIRDKMLTMSPESRFVLLVPAEFFFDARLYNFLLQHSLTSNKYLGAGKSKEMQERNAILAEMVVRTSFMQVFLDYSIDERERASLSSNKSDATSRSWIALTLGSMIILVNLISSKSKPNGVCLCPGKASLNTSKKNKKLRVLWKINFSKRSKQQ